MWASKVYLRWYKSFNIRFHGYVAADETGKSWEQYEKEFFPFVEIPLDRRIATIVGANESGKSHLLSAIEKILQGWSTTPDGGQEPYAIHHVCRYCALDGLEYSVWPHIGVELSFADKKEYDDCLTALQLTPTVQPLHDHDRVLRFFVDGASDSNFALVHDHTDARIASRTQAQWRDICSKRLPSVHYIDSRLALSNEVHVQQLLDMYDESTPSKAYDPLALHDLASELLAIELEANKPVPEATVQAVDSLRAQVAGRVLGPTDSVKLETLLFQRILAIDRPVLERIKELGASNRGYVERLVAEINHRLEEALDISQFWQQDDNFTLQVDYKGGFFYFLITDKTGAKYTFNERSSGLRYFLSYYIQAKAITQSLENKDAIMLMDEPDSFLSATAQKNLLQVFEALAQPIVDESDGQRPPRVQLVYTTHSPFLINRNCPQRISLVRKGDGSEGTQLVERSAVRRYEPVRSGLGIDCADTLFMGAMNVVLEGISDQKVFVSAIQAFGDPSKIDELLDLNKVTFISADGVSNVPGIVERSTGGSEKRPVVVVLLDGDAPGQAVAQELVAKKLLDEEFVATVDQAEVSTTWNSAPKELEDLIPPLLLAEAVQKYLKSRWNEVVDLKETQDKLSDADSELTTAKRMISVTRDGIGADSNGLKDSEIKGGVFDAFVDNVLNSPRSQTDVEGTSAIDALKSNVRQICKKLQDMLSKAEARARRDRLQKNVRLAIERFEKSHRTSATKADVERCLKRIGDDCIGFDSHARQARENIVQLQSILDEEIHGASELVKIETWLQRLRLIWDCPWKPREFVMKPDLPAVKA